jgi:hypothetical protein
MDDRETEGLDHPSDDTDDTSDETTEEPTDGGKLDEFDDPVLAADDTGMLAGERYITNAEIEEGTGGGGNV